MRIELETYDIDIIAQKVTERIKSLIPLKRECAIDTIFKPKDLAKYLRVDVSWVYKQVSLKAIPHFKSGKYIRFKKSAIDKWIETQTVKPIPSYKTN